MKFFTQEWYHNTLVSNMCFSLRKSNRAIEASDKFFEKLYKSEMAWYVKHLKRAAKFNRTPFDKTAAEAEFEKNYQDNLEFVKTLPDEITAKIADMRVFALGTVSYDMADELTRYCGRLNRECEAIQNKYDSSLEDIAERLGWEPINMLNGISDSETKAVCECDGRAVNVTGDRRITLEGGITGNDLVGASVIAFEISENDENGLYLGLLCESSDGSLFDKIIPFSSIEVEEIAEA